MKDRKNNDPLSPIGWIADIKIIKIATNEQTLSVICDADYRNFGKSIQKMAKRRMKKRTHVQPQNPNAGVSKNGAASMKRAPKSMVIRTGASEVGPSVSQLVKDVRLMMEPDTASRLKVRKQNMNMRSP